MVQNNLRVVVLEAREHLGGVWYYSEEETDKGGVMKSTRTTSSKTVTEMADFPMPEHYSHFPRHDEILAYLNAYCDRFNLRDHIRFNARVGSVEKQNDVWIVDDHRGKRYSSKLWLVGDDWRALAANRSHQRPDKGART
jgi:dimethylaniline monooxygenase (N-oxide forming)